MPDNPDEITAPMNLVNEFRFVSVLGVSSFWGSVGIILGLFWKKFDKTSNSEYS
jgi:predicted cobalt transporter CbtA